MNRGSCGCRLTTSGEGVQSGHSALRLTRSKPCHSKPFSADADAVTDRSAIFLHEVEIPVHRVDNDRAGRLVRAIEDGLPLKCRRQLLVARVRHETRLLSNGKLARLCVCTVACGNDCQRADQDPQTKRRRL